jgi:hypothetical protein
MAWEEFQIGTVHGITGDTPHDEMRESVDRINRAYLERYGRKAYLAELLYALVGVVAVDAPAYVADSELPTRKTLLSLLSSSRYEHIDPGEYKGVFDAETDDFLIVPESDDSGKPAREISVVRGQVVVNNDKDIVIHYRILSPAITDGMSHSLIRQCVLQDLMDYNIIDGGLSVRFERSV